VRILAVFHIALAISVLSYLLTLAVGVSALIPGELALAIGIYAGAAMGLSALGCVVTQLVLFISHKRHIAHG
jgi:hypothetical protein